jgi:Protein of unknown function (DUF4230)
VTTQLEPSPAKPTPRPLRWLAGILIGITITLALIWVALSAFTGYGLLQFARMLHGGQVHINVDQPTVIRQVRALQRLETVSYTMDKIISGERENPVLPAFLAGDKLLLVVHGEVVAGVDLSKLQPNDVVVSDRSVAIHLPQAEIFTTRLDSAKTRVYSRETGLFSSPDPNLESEVREEAERQLQAAALQDGILKTATANARQTLTTLLRGLGFETVRID